MERKIAFCGLDCSKCDAFIAAKSDDENLRKDAAKKWEKLYNHPGLKPVDINCTGCNTKEGVHFKHCTVCEIRKCAMERSVKSCAYCKEYSCDTLNNFHKVAPGAKRNLEDIRKDL
jgi:hypothetical protein